MTLKYKKTINLNQTLILSLLVAVTLLSSTFTMMPSAYSQKIIFQDDYSTNSGWTQVGTLVTVDDPSFPDIVKFNRVPEASDRRVLKSLGTTLSDTDWILESEIIINFHTGNPAHAVYTLTAGTGEPFVADQNLFGILYTNTGDPGIGFHVITQESTLPATIHGSKIIVDIDEKVYIRLSRTSLTTATFEVFSDAAKSKHVGISPIQITTIPNTIVGLNTLQHANISSGGSARNLTAEIDNTVILTDVVQQNQAPDCSGVTPSQDSLFPPNHKMKDITINDVTDADGDAVTLTIDGITQDEPTNGTGDGDTSPDGDGVGTDTAQIRAERSGTGDGRVYEISFTTVDGNGGMCTGSVTVGVPHDKKDTAVDSGQKFDSTQ